MLNKIKVSLMGILWALPVLALAQSVNPNYINSVGDLVLNVINKYIIPIIIAIAVVTFLVGIIKYIIAKDDEAKKEARGVMIYGIIGLFVMVSVWGLVGLLQNLTNVNSLTPAGVRPPTAVPGGN